MLEKKTLASMRAIPRLYLGTMTFGWKSQTSSVVDESVAFELMKQFVDSNTNNHHDDHTLIHRFDTARVYSGGDTEYIVGNTLRNLPHNCYKSPSPSPNNVSIISVGTKAHPSQEDGLSPKGIRDQLETSLMALGQESVDEFYLHQPDTNNPLEDSLRCCHELVQEGLIQKIGLSNYHALEVQRAFELCAKNDWTKPVVYQGLYNPLNRMVEDELMPTLREHGCSFVAYNPLAAGLLSGKHKRTSDAVLQGRFKDNPNYLPRFYTPSNFDAIDIIQDACDQEDMSIVDATFRWLLYHSKLNKEDGILIGASSIKQLVQNLGACQHACAVVENDNVYLPNSILHAFEDAWKHTREGAFPYWRSYSSDMPNREDMDPGASYTASKTIKL